MSIILPSNKIYKSNNSIIDKNEIRGIDFSSFSFAPRILANNQIDTKMFDVPDEGTFLPENEVITNITISDYDLPDLKIAQDYEIGGAASSRTADVAFAAINPIYKTILIEFPQNPNINTYNENHIEFKYSKTITKKTKSATISFKYQSYKPPMSSVSEDRYIFSQFTIGSTTSTENDVVLEDLPRTASASSQGASAEAHLENSRDPWQEYFVYDETTKKYSFSLTVLIGCWILSGATTKNNVYSASTGWSNITISNATLVEYVPQSIEVSLFGTQHILDLTEKTEKTNEQIATADLSINKNYLLQTKHIDNIKENLVSVTSNYLNGKETATLLCSVGDYYDENGNRVVSTETADKMTFNLYDEVLPLYRTPIGDAPMSMADGKPKIFKVLGSKVYFDGAVWQEISLQESGTTDYIVQNGTRGLSYTLRDDGGSYYCAGIGNATESEISIASIANGVPVTSVGSEAFRDNQQIKSVKVPSGIEEINILAFGESSLVAAELSDGLKYIRQSAFSYSNLSKIEIPKSVEIIENGAFAGCNLVTAIIKANIDKIEDAAFADCLNLRTVKFPSTVKKIGKMSFMNAAFDSIELGNVQEIGESAFRNCLNLKNVSLNKCVDIGNYAFATCGKIKVLSLNKNGVRVGKSAFSESGIESLTIPDNILSVGQQAFANCPNLKSVTIENGVNIALIDYTAFEGSPIENATSHIDTILLIPTTHLKKYTISGGETIPSGIFPNYTALENVIIGNTVKTIGDEAFYNCHSLASVTIGNGVTSIGSKAFQYCTSLTDVYITDLAAWCEIQFAASTSNPVNYAKNLYLNNKLVTELVIPDSVTSIGNYAFYNCDDFISVNIPDSVTSIGDGAFMRSTALESVTIGNGVTSIGFRAFGGCYSLVSITIPFVGATKDGASNTHFGYIFGASSYSGQKDYMSQDFKTVVITGGTKIDSNAFYNCSIESVTIPDSVTSIGDSAFYDCGLLTSITIGNGVTSIGDRAFDYCNGLTDVYYTGTEEQWNDITIGQRNIPLITAKKHFAK